MWGELLRTGIIGIEDQKSGGGRLDRRPGLWLLVNTVRHLKGVQLRAQVVHRLRRVGTPSSRLRRRPAPGYPGSDWCPQGNFRPPGAQENVAAELLRGNFRFLNEVRPVGWPPDWRADGAEKLWRYNLHYFEWLWALDFAQARSAVADWMENCPPEAPDAWEPYPVSLRVMNWCGVFWHRFRGDVEADPVFRDRLWESLYRQVEWLRARLEYHLLGNHLIENAAALALAGSCFAGSVGGHWLKAGGALLERELKEQMLPDGMHFERSPMYHARVTFLLLLLRAAAQPQIREIVQPYLGPALEVVRLLSHSDGRIALFNDSAFEISNDPRSLLEWGRALGVAPAGEGAAGCWSLPVAGYYGWRNDSELSLVCDAGAVGPDYIPGHAHGDIFSFELACRQHRIVVDSGVFDYLPSDMRRYCRSTRAHNTVTLDGQDQCEFWQAFRVGRRGRPYEVKWDPTPVGFRLEGWHDGYHRLAGKPRHGRVFSWHRDGVLMVRDEIESHADSDAASRIHFHPACRIGDDAGGLVQVETPAGPFAIQFTGPGELRREASWYCPEFGKRIPNQALVWSHRAKHSRFGFCLAPGRRIESFDLESGAEVSGTVYTW